MKRTRILLSLLTGRPEDLNLARRRIAHDRLILVATPSDMAQAEAARDSEASAGGDGTLDVVEMDGHDAQRLMAEMEDLLDRHRDAHIILNAAGGNGALFAAALYTTYARGLETWFFQEGRAERLPVLHGLRLSDRVTEPERIVLLALPDAGATSRHLAETLIVPRERIEKAFRGLRDKGLVRLDAPEGLTRAVATADGRYVQDHLVAQRNVPRTPPQRAPAKSASNAAT